MHLTQLVLLSPPLVHFLSLKFLDILYCIFLSVQLPTLMKVSALVTMKLSICSQWSTVNIHQWKWVLCGVCQTICMTAFKCAVGQLTRAISHPIWTMLALSASVYNAQGLKFTGTTLDFQHMAVLDQWNIFLACNTYFFSIKQQPLHMDFCSGCLKAYYVEFYSPCRFCVCKQRILLIHIYTYMYIYIYSSIMFGL